MITSQHIFTVFCAWHLQTRWQQFSKETDYLKVHLLSIPQAMQYLKQQRICQLLNAYSFMQNPSDLIKETFKFPYIPNSQTPEFYIYIILRRKFIRHVCFLIFQRFKAMATGQVSDFYQNSKITDFNLSNSSVYSTVSKCNVCLLIFSIF